MKSRHQVSSAALGLVKAFEGYRRSAVRLADGRWIIGYGHTQTAREGAEVSESDAEALLIYDLMRAANLIEDHCFTPLSQNQFDALAAFAFGVGLETFKTSAVLRLVNEGLLLEAGQAMEAWRKSDLAGETFVIDALIRRRAAEKLLFLTPEKGFVPAPAAVVAPILDPDAAFASPVEVVVSEIGGVLVANSGGPAVARAQDNLPLHLPADPPAPRAAEVEERRVQPAAPAAEQAELNERLYEIPGYSTGEFDPGAPRQASLPLLFGIGAAGLVFLGISFVFAMRGSNAELGGVSAYTVAAITGLAGAIALFSALYLILNRFDRES